jgi:hypothetical protein
MTFYRLNRAGFRKNLLNAEFMRAEMERRALRAKEFAESIAPDAPPIGEGYIASFEVESGTEGGIHHDRAYATLRNTSEHARYVEFGNGHEGTAHHVLTRALDVMGGE